MKTVRRLESGLSLPAGRCAIIPDMLDPKFVLENLSFVEKRLETRGPKLDFNRLTVLSAERKDLLKKVEDLRSERNRASGEVARMKKEGSDPSAVILAMRGVGEEISRLEEDLKKADEELDAWLLNVPNIPHASVPVGLTPADNVEIRRAGTPAAFPFEPEAHWDIGRRLGILDFDRAAKITGSRFAVYLNAGARLERALINFMLDLHSRERGYREIIPPFIANAESLAGTGNLPKFADDLFKIEGRSWYLIPTAEVPLTNYYRGEILEGASLPQRFVACTPCFRSEAGSYGKDIRGLIRQHQFNKVEMMIFSSPEDSFTELEKMTSDAEEVLKRLDLPYRVVSLCTGEMGFAGAKTYDLEVWMPSRNGYMEISSCSNCTDFQARRSGIRFRRAPMSKPEFLHTLNGSGLAVGRTLSAVLENGQRADGSVLIPEALRPYMDGLEKISS